MKKVKNVFLRKIPSPSKDGANHTHPIDPSGNKRASFTIDTLGSKRASFTIDTLGSKRASFTIDTLGSKRASQPMEQKNLISPKDTDNKRTSRFTLSPPSFTAAILAKMKKDKEPTSNQNNNELFTNSNTATASSIDITLAPRSPDTSLTESPPSPSTLPTSANKRQSQQTTLVDFHFTILGRQFCIMNCEAETLYYLCAAIRDMVEPILNVKINPILLELKIPCAKNANGIGEILTNKLLQEYGGLSNVLTKNEIGKDQPVSVEILGDMRRCFAASEENWAHQMQCTGEIQITPQLPNFLVDVINVFTYRFESDKKMETDVQESEQHEIIEEDSFPSVLDQLARRLGGNKIEVVDRKTGVITSFGAKFNAILKDLHQVSGSQPPEGCSPWVLEQKPDKATIIKKFKDSTSPPGIMQWLQYTVDLVCLLWDALPGLPALNIQGTITRNLQVPDDILAGSYMSSMLSAQQHDHGTITITRRNVPLLTNFQPEKIIPRLYSIQDLILQGVSIDEIKLEQEIGFPSQFKSQWAVEFQSPKLHMLRSGNLYKHCDSCRHLLEHHQSTSDLCALITHRTAFGGPYGAVIKRHGASDHDQTELAFDLLSNCIRDNDPYTTLDKFSDDGFIVFGKGGPTKRQGSIPSLKALCRAQLVSSGDLIDQQEIDKSKERLCSGCQKGFFKPAETIILWTCAQNFYGGMVIIGHYCSYLCVPSRIRKNIRNGNCAWER